MEIERKEINKFDEILIEFLEELDDVKDETKKQYTKSIKYFLNYLKKHNVSKPTPKTVKMWKTYLLKEKSPYTVNLYLSGIRRFFSFLEDKGLYKNIAKNVKGAKRPFGHQKDILTDEEIREIFGAIDTSDLAGKRNMAIIKTLAYTGLRTYSLINIKIKDIIKRNKKVLLHYKSKGHVGKDSIISLHKDVYESINEYLKERSKIKKYKPTDPLFISLSKNSYGKALTERAIQLIIDRYFNELGLKEFRGGKKLSAHSFRHTVITKIALKHGIETAKQIAGHKNIATTQIYYHEATSASLDADELIDFNE
ncbi:Phage integrase, N-terminal SAM-like domain [Marinitoga hydrogenitolerans DSM 16785]|uniref:Phage integrase, N-terminal SAM-like domain n=1 Tax=Marinitoga hydrogenitolerans (strain DSM 16785 / JCM 12826 / AT1271) TaxID=1122195 RepID=A0A1M5AJD6_MARH1|nr:tyrosine-type recombinase/integrase [Marinitoga hydrogenitolerans]SHF30244.1 Phage integrase, N-terminal SAM-like domain [Marinitoga hydrogenitolerans DSM 16785]